ncbi:MAG TPA: ABC transporter ATP-binding protein [Gemmatimonadales bacterium]|nr:ABC transporter ATP-binding protein [Gemmatimonadales bacterium]
MTALLEVRALRVSFPATAGELRPVDGVEFTVSRGEFLALVGESGAGKSLTGLALLRLVPPPGRIERGSSLRLDGKDLLTLDSDELRRVRGGRIAMVFQDPGTSLNPVLRVGDQIVETIRAHSAKSAREARGRAEALLTEVGLGDAEGCYHSYPHQLSGGMRQRVMIAIALAAEPQLLIADEPTSALDVTVQAQILELLDDLRTRHGMAVLLVTHDLGVVAERADRVAVMYAGRIVEEAPTARLFAAPAHPYTAELLASLPRLRGPRAPLRSIPGAMPTPADWPTGCRFRPRCPRAFSPCTDDPPITSLGGGHQVRCWLAAPDSQAAP